jgi:hypothetical protein
MKKLKFPFYFFLIGVLTLTTMPRCSSSDAQNCVAFCGDVAGSAAGLATALALEAVPGGQAAGISVLCWIVGGSSSVVGSFGGGSAAQKSGNPWPGLINDRLNMDFSNIAQENNPFEFIGKFHNNVLNNYYKANASGQRRPFTATMNESLLAFIKNEVANATYLTSQQKNQASEKLNQSNFIEITHRAETGVDCNCSMLATGNARFTQNESIRISLKPATDYFVALLNDAGFKSVLYENAILGFNRQIMEKINIMVAEETYDNLNKETILYLLTILKYSKNYWYRVSNT